MFSFFTKKKSSSKPSSDSIARRRMRETNIAAIKLQYENDRTAAIAKATAAKLKADADAAAHSIENSPTRLRTKTTRAITRRPKFISPKISTCKVPMQQQARKYDTFIDSLLDVVDEKNALIDEKNVIINEKNNTIDSQFEKFNTVNPAELLDVRFKPNDEILIRENNLGRNAYYFFNTPAKIDVGNISRYNKNITTFYSNIKTQCNILFNQNEKNDFTIKNNIYINDLKIEDVFRNINFFNSTSNIRNLILAFKYIFNKQPLIDIENFEKIKVTPDYVNEYYPDTLNELSNILNVSSNENLQRFFKSHVVPPNGTSRIYMSSIQILLSHSPTKFDEYVGVILPFDSFIVELLNNLLTLFYYLYQKKRIEFKLEHNKDTTLGNYTNSNKIFEQIKPLYNAWFDIKIIQTKNTYVKDMYNLYIKHLRWFNPHNIGYNYDSYTQKYLYDYNILMKNINEIAPSTRHTYVKNGDFMFTVHLPSIASKTGWVGLFGHGKKKRKTRRRR